MPVTLTILIVFALLLLAAILTLQVIHLRKKPQLDWTPVQNNFERTERLVRDEVAGNRREQGESLDRLATAQQRHQQQLLGLLEQFRQDSSDNTRYSREEIAATLIRLNDSVSAQVESLKTSVDQNLTRIHDRNAQQLEQMRLTVDEKLQGTLEKRLGESFKQVSERLEQVSLGLGEMRTLASGVGDLKKVLTNVKTRGAWGEVQLGAMLEQVMTPEQYGVNVDTRGSGERVEFAIKLPGRAEDPSEMLWLPLDAKFPIEDYQRIVDAQEKGDGAAVDQATKMLEVRIKACAKDICEKYIGPPRTTDFAILFLPTEGLFAEVTRCRGLSDFVQREHHVVIAGPTTLYAMLSSFQMGFRTLAIQKRSSEVWRLLGAVKTEFQSYGTVLAKVQKKLTEASNTIDSAATRSRAIEKKLRTVQELPTGESKGLLEIEADDDTQPHAAALRELD